MTKNVPNQDLMERLLQDRHEEQEKYINEVLNKLETIFPDQAQRIFIGDMFIQLYKLSVDMDDLNQNAIYQSSFIDALHKGVVGEDKVMSEEDFNKTALDSYNKSLEVIQEVEKQLTNEQEG